MYGYSQYGKSTSRNEKSYNETSRAPSRTDSKIIAAPPNVSPSSPSAVYAQSPAAVSYAPTVSTLQQQSTTTSATNNSTTTYGTNISASQQSVNGGTTQTTQYNKSTLQTTDSKVSASSSVIQISSEQVTDITAEFYKGFKADFSGITSSQRGYLESALSKLMDQYLLEWQQKELYPAIEKWLRAHLPDIVSRASTIYVKEKETIEKEHKVVIKEYESKIVTLEQNLKEGKEAVEEFWAAYERKMEEIRILLTFTKLTEREAWGGKAVKIWPELKTKVPFSVKPEVSFGGMHI
jgi:hypothetical protein